MILAARGTRNLDTGEEKIEDEKARAMLSKTARNIHAQALLAAASATGIAYLVTR